MTYNPDDQTISKDTILGLITQLDADFGLLVVNASTLREFCQGLDLPTGGSTKQMVKRLRKHIA